MSGEKSNYTLNAENVSLILLPTKRCFAVNRTVTKSNFNFTVIMGNRDINDNIITMSSLTRIYLLFYWGEILNGCKMTT